MLLRRQKAAPASLVAVGIRRRRRVSHWDSTILAAAQALNCPTLYSEALNDGQD